MLFWGGFFGSYVTPAMCLGCPEMPMQTLPQAPGGQRERPGWRGGRRADGNKLIPGSHKRQQPPPQWLKYRPTLGPILGFPSPLLPAPTPRFARKQRGPAPGHAAAPAGSRMRGMQRTSSPFRMERNFSLFFLSRCFLFSSPAEPGECFALQTANRWGGEDNIQDLKKFANASRISLKTALKYSVGF